MPGASAPGRRFARRTMVFGRPGPGVRLPTRCARWPAGWQPWVSSAATSSPSSATTARGCTGECVQRRHSAASRCRCIKTRSHKSSSLLLSMPRRASLWPKTRNRSISYSRSWIAVRNSSSLFMTTRVGFVTTRKNVSTISWTFRSWGGSSITTIPVFSWTR